MTIVPKPKAVTVRILQECVERTIEPDPKAALEYDHLFTCYRKIHDALAPVYRLRRG